MTTPFVDPVDHTPLTETAAGLRAASGAVYPPLAGGWDLRPGADHAHQAAIFDALTGEFSDFEHPHNLTLVHERALLDRLELGFGDRVLEIGGHRSGVLAYLERTRGVVGVGVDVSVAWVAAQNAQAELRGRGTRWVVADAEALPLPDGAVKATVAFDVFEHVGRLDRALAEVYRVLAPGGMLVCHLPVGDIEGSFDGFQRWRDPADFAARQATVGHYHERIPSRQHMRVLLEAVGFHVEDVVSFNVWLQPLHDHRLLPALARVRHRLQRAPKRAAGVPRAAAPAEPALAQASPWQRWYSRTVVPVAQALTAADRLGSLLGVGGSASFVARKGAPARPGPQIE